MVEEVDQQNSTPPIMVHDVGGSSSQLANEPPAIFSLRAYIPTKDWLVKVEDFTMDHRGDAFGLATCIAPLRVMRALEALKTFDLMSDSSQHLITVRSFHSFFY